ncbi:MULTISPECIES: hypothetical protein [unclassified Streptomyces]|uniref:hypothetical protein n=1 Tax=unclassified Streptomyces TaxID=2593676 RepID=UPI0006B069B8|nr:MULTISPECIES: hypothetical protein [unclassified Streptomyces]KOX25717.1 hypothetical protein ADL06_18040 [Streptomyces sp. NRRL F-6491]KOX49220.1 hypothetical protein ADL08_09075 [Streptomyces sp. NRRL F-6492]
MSTEPSEHAPAAPDGRYAPDGKVVGIGGAAVVAADVFPVLCAVLAPSRFGRRPGSTPRTGCGTRCGPWSARR